MKQLDFRSLVDTRIQLHWAVQLLGAAADATMEKKADDSHTNLGWDSETDKLIGRAGCDIDVAKFRLDYENGSFELTGKTLAESVEWLGDKMDGKIAIREYDMPTHAVAEGSPFSPDMKHLQDIAGLFSLAKTAMAETGELRIWPHHFDMGFLLPGDSDNTSIGGGFSPGDSHYEQPYFYVNPYGIEQPDKLPDVGPGHWTERWFGAVMTAEAFASKNDAARIATHFVTTAIAHCRNLISPS